MREGSVTKPPSGSVHPLDGSFSRSWWIVRKGYTRAEVADRTFPVDNGLLVIEGRKLPATATLVGPAGRKEITLRR